MRKILTNMALALLLGASPALATQGSVNLASPTGTVQTTSDATATNLINIGALCGAASATLYQACAFQVQVNSSGQLSISGPVTNAGTFAVQFNATPSLANGNGVVPTQGGAVLSATNGGFFNQLQGNAVLSTTNPAFTALSDSTTKVGVDATSTGLKVYLAGGASGVVNPNSANTQANSSPVVNNVMSHASTTALGTSLVAKASAGNLGAYNCTGIAGAAAGFCIVYNGTAAPTTGALTGANVLDFCSFDTSAKGCSLTRLPNSIAYSTGIVVLISSAASPYTYTTGTDTGAIEADYF